MFKKSSEVSPATSFRMESEGARPVSSKGVSVLGPTLTFKGGELTSDEDLLIEGTVESRIAHQGHHLTIGRQGKVKADVRARFITVHGSIEGDLHGDEGVHIAATAHVLGNVVAPKVSLENGARFQGSIITKEVAPTATRAPAPDAATVTKALASSR
jgi:cytoskeletal protein CcmA (bactofilin family)